MKQKKDRWDHPNTVLFDKHFPIDWKKSKHLKLLQQVNTGNSDLHDGYLTRDLPRVGNNTFYVSRSGKLYTNTTTGLLPRKIKKTACHYTGTILCHKTIESDIFDYDMWVSITLNVVDGMVTSNRLTLQPECNKQRLASLEKMHKITKQQLVLESKLTYKIYKKLYAPVVEKILNLSEHIIQNARDRLLFW